jgi:sulfur-oxidizing protein SoxZ
MCGSKKEAAVVEPIRMRARTHDGITDVQILMPHPMETGMRVDTSGQLLPAHYITNVEVSIGERTVFAARMSYAVSQDPLIFFRCRAGPAGQALRVTWVDNLGQQRSDQILF